MFSPTRRIFLLFTASLTGKEGLAEAYKTPQKAVTDLGICISHPWCHCSPFRIVWILVSVRLVAGCPHRTTGCCPPGLRLHGVQAGRAMFPQGPQPALTWLRLIRAMSLCTCLPFPNQQLSKLNTQMAFCTSKCFRSKILRRQPLEVHFFC